MKKILLPLTETERSVKALHYVTRNFSPEEAEIVLMMVDESVGYTARPEDEAKALEQLEEKMEMMKEFLEGYRIFMKAAVGKAGVRVVRAARETGADLIVMTKSAQEDMISTIGSTAEYIINNAPCDVLLISESLGNRKEYRGLIYKTASGVVTLWGQMTNKQSECLLPSVNVNCIYSFEVTVGKIRFYHTSYNPDTRNWDQPPVPGQEAIVDIAAGESADILVKADSNDGKADRVRILNRDMKKEAVFTYRISAATETVDSI
jgi:nucleotide-binding universal stress UspA family protein